MCSYENETFDWLLNTQHDIQSFWTGSAVKSKNNGVADAINFQTSINDRNVIVK